MALVPLLAEGEVLDRFGLGSLVIATVVWVITKLSSDLLREIARVVDDFTFIIVN